MPCEVKSESGIPTPFWGRRQLTVSSRMPRIFWLLHKSERTDPTSLAANTPTKRLANGVSGACCARAPDDQSAALGALPTQRRQLSAALAAPSPPGSASCRDSFACTADEQRTTIRKNRTASHYR